MNTIELKVYVEGDWQEFLIAELGDLDFDVFQQEDAFVNAYISAPRWDDVKREHVENWLRSHGLAVPVEECVIPRRNWNERWEEAIKPIAVGPFLIKPTWAEVPAEHADKSVLEIDPKMSFGTGYHESTRLILRSLPNLVQGGEHVLDAGTGTGILSIAAIKLGAEWAVAFDIDPWAQQNAVENFYLNDVDGQVAFRTGDIERVPETGFDLILANINRSVLVDLLASFADKIKPEGRVVLAGLLKEDRPMMLKVAEVRGFSMVEEATEGPWWSVVLRVDSSS